MEYGIRKWMAVVGAWVCAFGAWSQAAESELPWELQVEWEGPGVAREVPIGKWAPLEAEWREEVPWVHGVVAHAGAAGAARWTGAMWEATPVAGDDLTQRQRDVLIQQSGTWEALMESRFVPGGAREGSFWHFALPALRWNADLSCFERLLGAAGSVFLEPGTGGSVERWTVWPSTSPLAQPGVYQVAVARSGVYQLDAAFWEEVGLDVSGIDPRRVVIYGNGGRPLPMENAVDRPLGIRTVAAQWQGAAEDVWGAGDALYFYAQGPDWAGWDAAAGAHRHARHPWSDSAYYYVQVLGPEGVADARMVNAEAPGSPPLLEVDTYQDVLYHESEWVSPNRSGRSWLGEEFGVVQARTFDFPVPHPAPGAARLEVRVASRSIGVASGFQVLAGGSPLPGGGGLTPSATSESSTSLVYAVAEGAWEGEWVTGSGATARVEVTLGWQGANPTARGWLDYIRLVQPRSLRFSGSLLRFEGAQPEAEMGGAAYEVAEGWGVGHVWDVTDPVQPRRVSWTLTPEGSVRFEAPLDTLRTFCVFSGTQVARPRLVGEVVAQDLHAWGPQDLVIVTRPMFWEEAERLAWMHANEGMRVGLALQEDVFHAFSSGSPDPTALKMLMMMLRDRADGVEADQPRYLLLFGDGTFANRGNFQGGPYVITYQSANSASPTDSYVSDDYFGFLEPAYGEGIGDRMSIGVGRIPCNTVTEASGFVDKLARYMQLEGFGGAPEDTLWWQDYGVGSGWGTWRNTVCFVSDDMDGSGGPTEVVHMLNSDEHAQTLRERYNAFDVNKIYLDAYPQETTAGGERYPDAAEAIQRQMKRGALIVNYIGHGGEKGWAHERVLNTTMIQDWDNAYRMPLMMTATCELARFDDPAVESAGEMMVMNSAGGAVGMLTTTRVVFSGSNQQLNRAFYDVVLERGPSGYPRLGDVARATKNDPQVSSTSNKRNFSLLGDPALRLAYPAHRVFVDMEQDTLRALESGRVRGYVGSHTGDTLHDFSGHVVVRVFDKTSQVTTLNNDGAGSPHTYSLFRNVIFQGLASVEGGVFSCDFVVPRDIDYAFGPGRVSCYAAGSGMDAHGVSEDWIIGGVAETFELDVTPPGLALYMNDLQFINGGMTDANPTLLALVQDAGGINTSGVGIGHQMKAVLDGDENGAIVLNDYYVSEVNTFQRGAVRYPFEGLEEGPHRLEVTVWDVQNNKAAGTLDFVVDAGGLAVGAVAAYPNPTTDEVWFTFEHNAPFEPGTLTLDVFAPDGRQVMGSSQTWSPTGYRSAPWRWDLRNPGGNPVQPGVYVYRMTLQQNSGSVAQYSGRLVVLRP